MKTRRVSLVGTILVVLAIVFAACSPAATPTAAIPVTGATGTPAAGMTPTSVAAAPNSSSNNSTVNVGSNPKLGNILVGPTGMTLYEFANDTAGTSTCSGACTQTWPPLGVPGGGSPALGYGVTGDLSTTIRADGSVQVTFNGAPLYYFAGDRLPGDANGQGFGGKWFAVAPDGTRIRSSAVSSPTAPAASTGMPAAGTGRPTAPSATPTPAVPPATRTPTPTTPASG